jgi:hypothetical protein
LIFFGGRPVRRRRVEHHAAKEQRSDY